MVEYLSLSAATMKREIMCLLIGLYVYIASAKPPETVPFCNSTHAEYGSPATLRVPMEGLQERTKTGLAVRVFHESSNSSGNREDGEILFCAWTMDIKQNETPCTSTKANYEFVGLLNDTFSLKIKSTSVEENGIYVLNAHLFKTTTCRLKLSFTDMPAETTTKQTTVAASNVPSHRSAINDTPQATDETTDGGMIAAICSGIIFTVICVALLYCVRKSIGTGFWNFRRYLSGILSERSKDPEHGLTCTSAGSIGANGHVRNASSNYSLPSLQNGAAVHLAHDVEADGITAPATERNGTDIPQYIDQNIEDSGQACGTEDNDLERARTSVQSASLPESMPLLPKAGIQRESGCDSTDGQDDDDQLKTGDAEVCTAVEKKTPTTGNNVCRDDEGSPVDGFEQFKENDIEEAKENAPTETPHNETPTDAGLISMFSNTVHSLFGGNTVKQPEHAPVGT